MQWWRRRTAAHHPVDGPPDAHLEAGTGAIQGHIVTADLVPVSGAQVGIQGQPNRVAATSDQGRFTFERVPAGDHVLMAQKIGYAPAAQPIQVREGQTTDVTLQLGPLRTLDPRFQVYEFTGLISCSDGYAVIVSEECGAGLATPAGTFGTDPNNKIDWRFELEYTPDMDHLAHLLIELDWQPGSAAASQLALHVAKGMTCEPSCEEEANYCFVFDNYGPPVVTCEISRAQLGLGDDAEEKMPIDITARAWAAPSGASDPPNVVLQQSFTMYRTEFYDMDVPDGYSAAPSA